MRHDTFSRTTEMRSSRTRRFSPFDFSSFFGGLCRDLLEFSKCDTCHVSISNYIFYPGEELGRKSNITKQILERSQNILIGKLPYHLVILDTKFVCPHHDFPYRYTNQTNKLGDGTNIHKSFYYICIHCVGRCFLGESGVVIGRTSSPAYRHRLYKGLGAFDGDHWRGLSPRVLQKWRA